LANLLFDTPVAGVFVGIADGGIGVWVDGAGRAIHILDGFVWPGVVRPASAIYLVGFWCLRVGHVGFFLSARRL
jgi:hypothetical protein